MPSPPRPTHQNQQQERQEQPHDQPQSIPNHIDSDSLYINQPNLRPMEKFYSFLPLEWQQRIKLAKLKHQMAEDERFDIVRENSLARRNITPAEKCFYDTLDTRNILNYYTCYYYPTKSEVDNCITAVNKEFKFEDHENIYWRCYHHYYGSEQEYNDAIKHLESLPPAKPPKKPYLSWLYFL